MQIQALLAAVCVFCVADLVDAGCKQMKFDPKDLIDGKALQGHVFKAEKASDERHCRAKCFIENQCISYNYGLDKNNENNMCELNDADHVMHPIKLIGRQGTVYARAENNCSLCESFQVCTVNWVDKTQQCGCKPRFTGARCEIEIKPCDSSPCQNQGNCTNHPTEFEFSCKCNANFTGVYCESRVDPCLSNPCQNDGTCQALMSNTKYSCQCTNEFTGVNCHIHNPCSTNPCLNGGTCSVKADYSGYTCGCVSGYRGINCETASPCLSSPCRNGGSCNVNSDYSGYNCTCGQYYGGDNCETATSTCASGPCKNGGTCVPAGSGYTCTCPVNVLGADCGTAPIVSSTGGTWNNALADCKGKDANLPSIHSAAENQVAIKLYQMVNGYMWIGLKKSYNGVFEWSDGTPFNYTNWKTGGDNHACAYINYQGKWATSPCHYSNKHVCV